jgi:outer membrane protein OmpA-like peptidoglycan-associated protein
MTARQKGFMKGAAVGAAICGGTAAYVGHQNDSNPDKAALTGALACGLVGGAIGAILAKEDVVVPPEPVVETIPEPVPEPAVVEEVEEEIVVVEEVVLEKIVLRGINFDFDKSDIKPEFVPVLDEAVEILKERPDIKVIIEGHTDWTGTEKYNQGLSERRAASVCNYLVEQGISQNNLETVGYGEADPIADNHTREGIASVSEAISWRSL